MPEDSAKSSWWRAPGTQQAIRASAAAVPVAMVNGTAFIGQFAFWHQHVPWILPGQLLIAVSVEVVAVYLAWEAHRATMKNDSSSRLKSAALLAGQVVGAMNYSHYAAPHWRPTVMAVTMYFMSALSPLLWGVHTRRASRDILMERGLVEEHAVRLGGNRWTWHPLRSARVTYWATWHGINEPARAIARFAYRYGTADVPAAPRQQWRAALARATEILDEDLARAEDEPGGAPVAAPAMAHAPAGGNAPAGAPAPLPWPVPRDAPRAFIGTAPWPAAPEAGAEVAAQPSPAAPPVAPAEVTAAVAMRAEPSISPGQENRPDQEVISGVELQLAGMQDDSLPSVRQVARMLSTTSDQRRLAGRLLAQRRQAGARRAEAPAGETVTGNGPPHQGTAPGMIASPQGFQPGGTHGG